MSHETYESPLTSRYASKEMSYLFSPQSRISTWRRLWIALAEAEHDLGLPITQEQIDELKAHVDTIDFDAAAEAEKKLRHDVMAHIHTYGDQCPKAKRILHLGATSCFVTDNADLLAIREGMNILLTKLVQMIRLQSDFAEKQATIPCLGFTHLQPAQLTTVGKRACLWIQELLLDLEDLEHRQKKLQFLGCKGTTGTQASFLELFDGDHDKVKELDKRIAEKMGFQRSLIISGQTYTRKQDAQVLDVLSGIATTLHKFASDLRLLIHLQEFDEPFRKKQIGSSAMPYKRNPILSERICALSRFLISLGDNAKYTAATQWFERTLDDSANRRLTIPEAFLTADALLNLGIAICSEWKIYPRVIEQRTKEHLPFMATENILMQAVSAGGDRQELHERLRQHSLAAAQQMKEEGKANDLLDRIVGDKAFKLSAEDLQQNLSPSNFIGRAPQQVSEFLEKQVKPVLERYRGIQERKASLSV